MDDLDFRTLMMTDPLNYEHDPLGLLTYFNYKRRRGIIGEQSKISSVEFLNILKERFSKNDISYNVSSVDGVKSINVISENDEFSVKLDDIHVTIPASFLNEVLTPQQRMRRKLIMRRLAPKIARARKIAMRRRAGTDVLKRRALALARKAVSKKLLGGRNKADVSAAEKARVEKLLAKRKSVIQRLAVKFLPLVRKKQAARFSAKPVAAKPTASKQSASNSK